MFSGLSKSIREDVGLCLIARALYVQDILDPLPKMARLASCEGLRRHRRRLAVGKGEQGHQQAATKLGLYPRCHQARTTSKRCFKILSGASALRVLGGGADRLSRS